LRVEADVGRKDEVADPPGNGQLGQFEIGWLIVSRKGGSSVFGGMQPSGGIVVVRLDKNTGHLGIWGVNAHHDGAAKKLQEILRARSLAFKGDWKAKG